MERLSIRKNDIFLICIIVILAIVALLTALCIFENKGHTVVVSVNGSEYARLSLEENTEILIENDNGEFNRLVIKDGVAIITEASCKNQICVKAGKASPLKSIVCSPNRVIVSIESEDGQ